MVTACLMFDATFVLCFPVLSLSAIISYWGSADEQKKSVQRELLLLSSARLLDCWLQTALVRKPFMLNHYYSPFTFHHSLLSSHSVFLEWIYCSCNCSQFRWKQPLDLLYHLPSYIVTICLFFLFSLVYSNLWLLWWWWWWWRWHYKVANFYDELAQTYLAIVPECGLIYESGWLLFHSRPEYATKLQTGVDDGLTESSSSQSPPDEDDEDRWLTDVDWQAAH